MDGWWDQVESEIRECVERHGSLTTPELARHLRMSESATESVLRVLTPGADVQIQVRLGRREPQPPRQAPQAAA